MIINSFDKSIISMSEIYREEAMNIIKYMNIDVLESFNKIALYYSGSHDIRVDMIDGICEIYSSSILSVLNMVIKELRNSMLVIDKQYHEYLAKRIIKDINNCANTNQHVYNNMYDVMPLNYSYKIDKRNPLYVIHDEIDNTSEAFPVYFGDIDTNNIDVSNKGMYYVDVNAYSSSLLNELNACVKAYTDKHFNNGTTNVLSCVDKALALNGVKLSSTSPEFNDFIDMHSTFNTTIFNFGKSYDITDVIKFLISSINEKECVYDSYAITSASKLSVKANNDNIISCMRSKYYMLRINHTKDVIKVDTDMKCSVNPFPFNLMEIDSFNKEYTKMMANIKTYNYSNFIKLFELYVTYSYMYRRIRIKSTGMNIRQERGLWNMARNGIECIKPSPQVQAVYDALYTILHDENMFYVLFGYKTLPEFNTRCFIQLLLHPYTIYLMINSVLRTLAFIVYPFTTKVDDITNGNLAAAGIHIIKSSVESYGDVLYYLNNVIPISYIRLLHSIFAHKNYKPYSHLISRLKLHKAESKKNDEVDDVDENVEVDVELDVDENVEVDVDTNDIVDKNDNESDDSDEEADF